jgi:hypothetical protein
MTSNNDNRTDAPMALKVGDVIGDLELPRRGGKMLRRQIELADGSCLVVPISRRHKASEA